MSRYLEHFQVRTGNPFRPEEAWGRGGPKTFPSSYLGRSAGCRLSTDPPLLPAHEMSKIPTHTVQPPAGGILPPHKPYGCLRNSATVITRPIPTTAVRTTSRPRRWARRAPAYPPAIEAAAMIKASFQRIDPGRGK